MVTDILVIGGGPAGMSSALSASENGSKVTIVERDEVLGGILNQCIHNGFGLHYFKEELTGPEFAYRFRKMVEKDKNITVLTRTMVTELDKNVAHVQGKGGMEEIRFKACILAMGCRERTAGNISLNGTRPMGVITAGTAQKMANIDGKMVGKDVVILGSGDIGLIMARRLTLEGARVHAVFEINSTTSGLRRNIMQCLDDFNIPLYYNTTIFEVVGKDRVEGVYYGQVDENYRKLEETRKFMKCDTVILSVGLVPDLQLLPNAETNPRTNGLFVNEYYQASLGSFHAAMFCTCMTLLTMLRWKANKLGFSPHFTRKTNLKKARLSRLRILLTFPMFFLTPSLKARARWNLNSASKRRWSKSG